MKPIADASVNSKAGAAHDATRARSLNASDHYEFTRFHQPCHDGWT